MDVFAPLKFGWDGQEQIIPASNIFKLAARIEDKVSFQSLMAGYEDPAKQRFTDLAVAISVVLEAINIDKSPESVYEMLMTGHEDITSICAVLPQVIMPQVMLTEDDEQEAVEPTPTKKKNKRTNKKKVKV